MLKGPKVILRPMQQEDIPRQHEFNQDVELYGLDCDPPHVSPLESARAFYESSVKPDENTAAFTIEAGGKYIGYCTIMHLQNRLGNLELGILIGDRDYWDKGYRREAVRLLLLEYGFHYLGALP